MSLIISVHQRGLNLAGASQLLPPLLLFQWLSICCEKTQRVQWLAPQLGQFREEFRQRGVAFQRHGLHLKIETEHSAG